MKRKRNRVDHDQERKKNELFTNSVWSCRQKVLLPIENSYKN